MTLALFGHSQIQSYQFTRPLPQSAPFGHCVQNTRRRQHFAVQAEAVQTEQKAVAKPEASAHDQDALKGAELPNHALAGGDLQYRAPTVLQRIVTSWRLLRALPWRRFASGSVLVIEIDGEIAALRQDGFRAPVQSMPQICEALLKAARDPRIVGVCLKISPVQAGWAKLQELRQYIKYFRGSGKFTLATLSRGGEKEYFLACACEEIYMPPTANVYLTGFSVAGTFLRGTLEKIGIEPQVKRIGKFKSAGDQLLRADMSDPQREQLTALLEDIYEGFTETVAADRGKTPQEVEALIDAGVYDMETLANEKWVTGLKYNDEVIDMLKQRTGGKKDKVRSVGLKRYAKVSPSAFAGLMGGKVIAVVRAAGAIVGGGGGPLSSVIIADRVIKQLRKLEKRKNIAAVVLRVDSGGGDALASDLMWREIRQLSKSKPVIASMGDVAASGGYYMAMGCSKIVAESLTITGSIGVVTGKFNLEKVYDRIAYNKTIISKGRYAELLSDNRTFTTEEEDQFDKRAWFAYESFRDRAAASRGMHKEELEKHAQGRVWSGKRALEVGLVDALGSITRAVAIAKQAAKIEQAAPVQLLEVSSSSSSPLALLSGGASALATLPALLQWYLSATVNASPSANPSSALLQLLGQRLTGSQQIPFSPGTALAVMPDLQVDGVSSAALQSDNVGLPPSLDILQ